MNSNNQIKCKLVNDISRFPPINWALKISFISTFVSQQVSSMKSVLFKWFYILSYKMPKHKAINYFCKVYARDFDLLTLASFFTFGTSHIFVNETDRPKIWLLCYLFGLIIVFWEIDYRMGLRRLCSTTRLTTAWFMTATSVAATFWEDPLPCRSPRSVWADRTSLYRMNRTLSEEVMRWTLSVRKRVDLQII